MLVPAVKQRASNNLIMRLEMPGREGAGAVLLLPMLRRQLAEPESCQAVSCLSPCFSLAPRRAAVRADGAGPAAACHRRAVRAGGTGACTDPKHVPSVSTAGKRCSAQGWVWAWLVHVVFPRVRMGGCARQLPGRGDS